MCPGQVLVAGVEPPGSRYGSALPLPLVHCTTAADDQIGAFPDERGNRDSPPSGYLLQLCIWDSES